jgi:spore coat protein JB
MEVVLVQTEGLVEMLRQIQAVDFAIYELGLFLDTHPEDKTALEYKNKLAQRSHQLKANYEQKYGVLRIDSFSRCPYQYINDPWPWEIRYR